MSSSVELPLLDEHAIHTPADPIRVWEAIPEGIEAVFDQPRSRAIAGFWAAGIETLLDRSPPWRGRPFRDFGPCG